jgi:hypothetical protein
MPMSRKERIGWFEKALGLKKINVNRGTINCAHCALRFDTYLRQGSTNGKVNPVSKTCANLYTEIDFKGREITRSFITDQRIIDRCQITELNDQTLVVYDITNEDGHPIVDLTYLEQDAPKKVGIRLNRVKTKEESLKDRLQLLLRGNDGTAYGFIWLADKKKRRDGHVINYFVDSHENNNEVYFIDPQLGEVVDESYFRKFHSDVFYLPSLPSGGFAIKKEYNQDCLVPAEKASIKTENTLNITELKPTTMVALTPQEFIQKVIKATKTEDINKIEKLNFVDELIDEMQSANPLATIEYNEIAANAAMGGYEALVNKLIEKMQNSNLSVQVDYFLIAIGAAFGGLKALVNALIEKMQSVNPQTPVNYNGIARCAAMGGQGALVDVLIDKMQRAIPPISVDYRGIARVAENRGHGALANTLIEKMLESVIEIMQRANPLVPVNYNEMAARLAKNGDEVLVNALIQKMQSANPPISVNYREMVRAAALGGHGALVATLHKKLKEAEADAYFEKMRRANLGKKFVFYEICKGFDDYEIAECAAIGGHETIVNAFIERKSTAPFPVDYNRIAQAAAFGGHQALADAIIEKMQSANLHVSDGMIPQSPVKSDHPFATVLQFSTCHRPCTLFKEAQENQVNTLEPQVSTSYLKMKN